MGIPDITLVVAVDREHLEQLRLVWPTWIKHRPEIKDWPILILCDEQERSEETSLFVDSWWREQLTFLCEYQNVTAAYWRQPTRKPQRERALSALIFGPAKYVKTDWYLKLDTDAVAERSCADWLQEDWFKPVGHRTEPVTAETFALHFETPVFITNPWSFSKPADVIDRLDEWGDTVPELRDYPRLNLHPKPGWSRVRHKRIISWCFFGRTDFARKVATMCEASCGPGRLPVPSQDSVMWYVAKRQGRFFLRVGMKKFGWNHWLRMKKIREQAEEALR